METTIKKTKQSEKRESCTQFREFFIDCLRDIYWAEKELSKELPKLTKAISCKELSRAIEKHINETEHQIGTLEQVFELLGEKAHGKKCAAMAGLLEEASSMIDDTEKESCTRDAGLILAAQKVEHYEIATYGTLVAFARQMGETQIADLLQRTLDEEKRTDGLLTKVAEGSVNLCAVEE